MCDPPCAYYGKPAVQEQTALSDCPRSPSPPYSGERGWGEGVLSEKTQAPSPPTPRPGVPERGGLGDRRSARGIEQYHMDLARTVYARHQTQLDVAGLARPGDERQTGRHSAK